MFFLIDWLQKLVEGKPREIAEAPEENKPETKEPEKPTIHPKRKVPYWND